MPFDAVQDHQLEALSLVKQGKFYYKIPDSGYDQKPFDAFSMIKAEAYVVIQFYTSRGEKTFYVIDVDDFINERATSERKSLTRDRAREIGREYQFA